MTLFDSIPFLRRRFVGIGLIPAAAIVSAASIRYLWTKDSIILFGSAAAVLLGLLWCILVGRYCRRRAKAILIRTRGLTCTGCGYSLVGMDENGACPECGTSYYADHLTQCWAKAAGFP